MFKQLSSGDISHRNFKAYKKWFTNQDETPIIHAKNNEGLFDPDTSPKVKIKDINGDEHTIYTDILYRYIISKYYSSKGNVITQYGKMKNPAKWKSERQVSDEIYVLSIPQMRLGEGIKPGSVLFKDLDTNVRYVDDGHGNLITPDPIYYFTEYDAQTGIMKFSDDVDDYEVLVKTMDYSTGRTVIMLENTPTVEHIIRIDFSTNLIHFQDDLGGTIHIRGGKQGNIFYTDGLIVITSGESFTNYSLEYRSTVTITETEILVETKAGEFNYSQNPSAVEVDVANSYTFTTTPIKNGPDATDITIKEINSISRRNHYTGTTGSVVGTWDDYETLGENDPTGSYLAPFVTTIGLYDKNGDMMAVARLSKPIKKLPDQNLNFLIRFDT